MKKYIVIVFHTRKSSSILLLVLILVAFVNYESFSTDWKKIKSLSFQSQVTNVSIDRYGMFYIADEDGNIFKYDTLGQLQLSYSPSRKADVSLIEAWRNVNIFVFYRNLQEYILLDRFLSPTPNQSLTSSEIGFARLATFSYDNNIWLIDETNFSLKKYNIARGKTELNTPLDLLLDPNLYDMNFIKEYQNLVFVNDKNSGVLIFDNMGNYKTKIPVKGLSQIGFFNDEIYFQDGENIKFINIYTYLERTEILPEKGNFQFILYTKNNLYLFNNSTAEVYKRQ